MHRSARQMEKAEAFERIISHYEARLIRYAERLTGSNEIAQDVVQDAFIRLFRRWPDKLEPSSALSGWLYRVTHNRAVDIIRRRSRRAEAERQHAADRPDCVVPPEFRTRDQIQAAAALQALSPRERQLVILKVYEGKTYREIGEITGLTSGNVGYILHHAMKKMAMTLKEAESE